VSCKFCGAPADGDATQPPNYDKFFMACNMSGLSAGDVAKKLGMSKLALFKLEPRFVILDAAERNPLGDV
jgi:hypothetical protein